MAKGSGINTKQAKKTYNAVKGHAAKLDSYIKQLQKDVESMNKETWYGGKKANNWYKSMDEMFTKLVKFDNGIGQFQNELEKLFAKSSASGIDYI